jgi:hypothetical protein
VLGAEDSLAVGEQPLSEPDGVISPAGGVGIDDVQTNRATTAATRRPP